MLGFKAVAPTWGSPDVLALQFLSSPTAPGLEGTIMGLMGTVVQHHLETPRLVSPILGLGLLACYDASDLGLPPAKPLHRTVWFVGLLLDGPNMPLWGF